MWYNHGTTLHRRFTSFMIPEFPNFKKLELSDRKEVEEFTSKFPPYSDFNFTSLWTWNTKDARMLSKLNENLVILFTDYETNKPSLSFLGVNKLGKTASELLNFAKNNGLPEVLSFIPEELVKELGDSGLSVEEDRDNFDYIFSLSQLSTLRGLKYKAKRRGVNNFLALYPNVVFKTDKSVNPILYKHIARLVQKWTTKKESGSEADDSGFKNEEKALRKILETENKNLLIFTCFLNDNLIGFEIDEMLSPRYAMAHFSKANTSYKGIYDFLNTKLSKYLKNEGVEFCNWEQDLGIGNLRKSKMSYCPVGFLKKYKVSIINR